MITEPVGHNASRWDFHFKMSGYNQGKMGAPLNPEFMHELPYIKGYAVGILEYQKALEKIEQDHEEASWIYDSNRITSLTY